jgi:hypothetical protein
MGNFNDIILHRNEVRDNILKSFDSDRKKFANDINKMIDEMYYEYVKH